MPRLFHEKNTQKTRTRRKLAEYDNGNLWVKNSTANITRCSKTTGFYLNIWNKTSMLTPIQHCTQNFSQNNQEIKTNNSLPNWKGSSKTISINR